MRVHLRKIKISSGRTLVLDYYLNRERIREYLHIIISHRDAKGKEKMMLAEKIRAQREIELAGDYHGIIPAHLKRVDFFAFFEDFITQSTRKDIRLFKACKKKLMGFASKSVLPMNEINESFCQRFSVYLRKGLYGETPFNYFQVFRRVLSEAVKKKVLARNPSIGVVNKNASAKVLTKEVLTSDEILLLSQTYCGSDEVRNAFLFSCFTGLRGGDVRMLKFKNIDYKNCTVRLSQRKTDVHNFSPFNKSVLQLLPEPGNANDLVFSLPSQNAMNKDIKHWVVRAKIKKHITFNCARHSFATLLLVSGADLKTTSRLLGHTTTRQTERYTHISDQMKRKAVDALPVLV